MIYRFRGEYFFLSNFYKCDFVYDSVMYHSSEAAYMSAKRLDYNWKDFCSKSEPAVIKKKSREVKIRDDWDSIKINVMFDVLRLKFQIPELRDKLLATGDMYIEEGNTHGDKFWGVSLETKEGRNFLGRILMKIRDELRLTDGK